MVGPIVLPSVAPAWFADFIFQVKAVVGQHLPLRNVGARCSLTLEWHCCFRLWACVSAWWTRTHLQPLLLVPLLCAPGEGQCHLCKELPCGTFLVQKHLGLIVGLSQLVNNYLIRGGRLLPLSSQFPGLEVLSSLCLVLEQDKWRQCQLGLVGDSKMLFVPCLWLLCWALPGWRKVTRVLPLRNFLGGGLQCSIQETSLMPCTYIGRTVQIKQDYCLGGLIPSAVKFGWSSQCSWKTCCLGAWLSAAWRWLGVNWNNASVTGMAAEYLHQLAQSSCC